MAQQEEPMDIDISVCDFDNKENSFGHSNVLPKTPSTEKGYEELDSSELSMRLRYSITPSASPMTKSLTTIYTDNRPLDFPDTTLSTENNLTRSLNATVTNSDSILKGQKVLPLQSLPTDTFTDANRNPLRPLDDPESNVTVSYNVDNMSLPSSSSSMADTPEATTPTKDIPKDGGQSPIMRGLKSVLNMFRPSQSPIPSTENEVVTPEALSPPVINSANTSDSTPQVMLVSTPLAAQKDGLSMRSSQNRDSITFKDNLEKELQWTGDDSAIIFSHERIPVHKLFFQNTTENKVFKPIEKKEDNLDSTEHMDISYNTTIKDNTLDVLAGINALTESDGEFEDCESTFTKSHVEQELNMSLTSQEPTPNVMADSVFKDVPNGEVSKTNEQNTTQVKEEILAPENLNVESNITIQNETSVTAKNEDHKVTEGQEIIVISEPTEMKTIDKHHSMYEKVSEIKETSIVKFEEQETNFTKKYNDNVTNKTEMLMEMPSKNIELENLNPINALTETTEKFVEIKEATVACDTQNTEPEINIQLENTNENLCQQTAAEDENTVCLNQKNTIEHPTISELVKAIHANRNELIVVKDVISNGESRETLNVENSDHDQQTVLNTVQPSADNIITKDVQTSLSEAVTDNIIADSLEGSTNVHSLEKPSDMMQSVNTPAVESNVSVTCAEIPTEHKAKEPNIISDLGASAITRGEMPDLEIITAESILTVAKDKKNLTEEKTEEVTSSEIEECILREYRENIDQIMALEKALEEQEITAHDTVLVENVADVLTSIVEEKVISIDITENTTTTIGSEPTVTSLEVIKDMHKSIQFDNNSDSNFVTDENKHNLHEITVERNNVAEITDEFKESNENDLQTACISENKVENLSPNDIINPLTTASISMPPVQNMDISFSDVLEVINNDAKLTDGLTNIYNQTDIVKEIIPDTPIQDIQEITQDINIDVHQNTSKPAPCNSCANILKDDDKSEKEESNENKTKAEDVEIVTSEGNSPFVSVSADDELPECEPIDGFEEIDNPFASKSKIQASPPTSPAIVSKGYNFNFDEIDDPFATKTKIRMSPPSGESPAKLDEPPKSKNDLNKNRCRSQPERKKPAFVNRKMNSTIAGKSKDNQISVAKTETTPTSDKDLVLDEAVKGNKQKVSEFLKTSFEEKDLNAEAGMNATIDIELPIEETKSSTETVTLLHEVKTASSSEQSAYYSADTSSEGSVPTMKSSFNLPEINDVNFNPFATKSKISLSPPPSLDVALPIATSSKILSSAEEMNLNTNTTFNINDSPNPNDISAVGNRSEEFNATASSKESDDKNVTVQEVHTDNEDTIEGPFLDIENDMMKFTEPLPVRMPCNKQENADAGELFIDAEAFEFLLNKNQPNMVADSGKESLFLKFDPLFAKRMSSGMMAAINQHRQSLNSGPKPVQRDLTFDKSSAAGPSTLNATQDIESDNVTEESFDELNVTVSKPMMVVSPAVNPVPSPRKTLTTPKANRRSLTFTSPAIAVIDRLLSMSANNSVVGQDTTVDETTREHNEADLALTQLRELLADKEISVYNLRSERKELQERLSTLESQLKSLEQTSEERLKKINELSDALTEKSKVNKNMAKVVEEYERTISSLISEIEQDKKRHAEERAQLIQDRDEQSAHLASMEVSFNDLHSKYEKSKQVILGFKTNEDSYQKSIKEFEENLSKMQSNYELLKQHATAKLNHANEELQKINRAHESEVLKLNAMIKRKELHITSLEETLQQKTKANDELTAICDELISRVN